MTRARRPAGPLATSALAPIALAAALATGLAACSNPDVTPPAAAPTSPDADPTASQVPSPGPAPSVPDPREAAVLAEARDLVATLADASTAFDQLTRTTDLAEATSVSQRLLATLSAHPRWADPDGDGTPDVLAVRPLLPGPDTSREETVDYGDAFSAVLAAARDAGATGEEFADVLRDPVVGDLGAWQRDPAGMLDNIVNQVDRVRDVTAAEAAVKELQGEGPRALAWAVLAEGAAARRDLDLVHAYGERGAVHVELMLSAVRPLVDGVATQADDA